MNILLLIIFVVLALYALIEPWILTVTPVRLRLKGAEDLRIAVIGDFHVGPFKGRRWIDRIVRKTNALKPDLILLVGDFLFDGDSSPEALRGLADLDSTYGCYAVLGNHENRHVLSRHRKERMHVTETPLVKVLREAHIRTLHNEHAVLKLPDGHAVAIAGIEDLWSGLDDIQAALKDVPADLPVILLSHNPDVILDPESRRADLIVSGHTHAGQIRLPFWGHLSPIPQQLQSRFVYGHYQLRHGTQLLITRGVGESGLPLRFLAAPEIMLVETR